MTEQTIYGGSDHAGFLKAAESLFNGNIIPTVGNHVAQYEILVDNKAPELGEDIVANISVKVITAIRRAEMKRISITVKFNDIEWHFCRNGHFDHATATIIQLSRD